MATAVQLGFSSGAQHFKQTGCPLLWPELDHIFKVVKNIGTPVVALATQLKSVLNADLITGILKADKAALPKEFTDLHWLVMADLCACSDGDEDGMSGQRSVNQAITGTIVLDVVLDSSNSQEALRDANVYVDAVVL